MKRSRHGEDRRSSGDGEKRSRPEERRRRDRREDDFRERRPVRGEVRSREEEQGRNALAQRRERSEVRSREEEPGPSAMAQRRERGEAQRREEEPGPNALGQRGERGQAARGRGGSRRGGRGNRHERLAEDLDMVVSRPRREDGRAMTKRGDPRNSRAVQLQSNYFKVLSTPNWGLYQYQLDFNPEEDDTRVKKKLIRQHQQSLGQNICDGQTLYLGHILAPDPMVLTSFKDNRGDGSRSPVEVTVRRVGTLAPTDPMYLHIFNIIIRQCQEKMGLEEIGRHFFNKDAAIDLSIQKLTLWPGYKISIRNHEHDILLGVDITHKVLRNDTCHDYISGLRAKNSRESEIRNNLVGRIVMTRYNRMTYKVDDIAWDKTPRSTFDMKGEEVTFEKYFWVKYGLRIEDLRQPLLVSRPTKRTLHRGRDGLILLIPELCLMTGLSDEMRVDFNLLKSLSQHLHSDPGRRVDKIKDFMHKLKGKAEINETLQHWGLKFDDRLVEFSGRQMDPVSIKFGENKSEMPNKDTCDFNHAFRTKPLFSTVPLRRWVIITPSREAHVVDNLVSNMQRVSGPIKFNLAGPCNTYRIPEAKPKEYAQAVDKIMSEHGPKKEKLQLIFAILPRHASDTYSAVKKRACVQFGIPSQCFVAGSAKKKGFLSICTKLVVQMSAKIGGGPWTVDHSIRDLMVVGFDVYHCGSGRGASVGAMVATLSKCLGKYYSTVSMHSDRSDLSQNMSMNFTKCLTEYNNVNKTLPMHIIMYRDGVGDGMLKYVNDTELAAIKDVIEKVYTKVGKDLPKFTFIIVTKKINTKIFLDPRSPRNPGPGTVVDDVITLPERYDFYLVSQFSRMGTVAPVSYNVLYDTLRLEPGRIQRFTYKLCHMYFNWTGTVTVPAPCQYAKKLAYLTGTALNGPSHERLSNFLYYL